MATKEILAIAITLLVHVIALVALVWTLLGDSEDRPDWRDWWPGDDDDGPRDPSPDPRGGDLPLTETAPSAVRLRGPAPRPSRRPSQPPERVPGRTPASR